MKGSIVHFFLSYLHTYPGFYFMTEYSTAFFLIALYVPLRYSAFYGCTVI